MPLFASARRRLAPAAIALLAFLAVLALGPLACVNQIGITCPPDDPSCDEPDLAAPDLAAPDLAAPPDLAHPIADLATCKAACPNGCCDDKGGCNAPSLLACGRAGEACMRCDPAAADNCKDGLCRCGLLEACSGGTRCVGGKCTCDGTSCPNGCCDANGRCQMLDVQHCTLQPGGGCKVCDANADTCQFGTGCTCGNRPPCAGGQRCDKAACLCDQKSCPNGCCLKDACLPGNLFTNCGTGGSACTPCQITQTCANGACVGILACAIGQVFCPGMQKCGIDCTNCGNFGFQCPNGSCVESCKNCPNYTASCVPIVGAKSCVKDCNACLQGACTP